MQVVIARFRLGLLPITLALAFVVAITLVWTANAESKAGKPVPEDRIADVQLLGVNDFHGNLESPRTLPYNGTQVPVGGAEYLDAYLDKYEAQNPDRTIRVHAGDMVGASPSSPATSTTSRPSTPPTTWSST